MWMAPKEYLLGLCLASKKAQLNFFNLTFEPQDTKNIEIRISSSNSDNPHNFVDVYM